MLDPKKIGGDDLDDFDIAAVHSGDEAPSDDDNGHAIHPSRRKAVNQDADDEGSAKKSKKNKKRKGNDGTAVKQSEGSADGTAALSKAEKRKRQKEKWKSSLKSKDAAEDHAITGDAGEQFELVWRQFLAHGGAELSELEVEPIKIESEDFADPPEKYLHQARDLADMRPFLKGIVPDWSSAFSKKGAGSGRAGKVTGAPCVVVLTSAALTAANIFKELKEFNSLCRVGKLFAKHLKVEEQEEFLKTEITRIVVGTPNRIAKLIEIGVFGALRMDQVRFVVVDARRDAKGMNVFGLKPLCNDLMLLCKAHVFPLMRQKKLKMVLF